MVGFYTPLTVLDRLMSDKINKDIRDLNSSQDQMDLIDIYKNSPPQINSKYILLSII